MENLNRTINIKAKTKLRNKISQREHTFTLPKTVTPSHVAAQENNFLDQNQTSSYPKLRPTTSNLGDKGHTERQEVLTQEIFFLQNYNHSPFVTNPRAWERSVLYWPTTLGLQTT